MTENVHTGKRIRFFRERRGSTQKQLCEEAGIIDATIRKYEIGQKTPKLEQIKVISDALGITPFSLSPIEIETDVDVLSLILALEEKLGMTFDGKKDGKGKTDPKTLTFHIEDLFVNDALARYGNAKNHLTKLKTIDVPKKNENEHQKLIESLEDELAKTTLILLESNKLIGQNHGGIAVKNSPDISNHFLHPKTE